MPRSGIKAPTKTARQDAKMAAFSVAQFGNHHGYSAGERVTADHKFWKLGDAQNSERALVRGEGPTASDVKYRHNVKVANGILKSNFKAKLRSSGLANRAR